MNDDSAGRQLPMSADARRFGRLLRAYPHVEPGQVEQMIATFPRLTILDTAHLAADRLLSPRFAAFVQQHRARLGRSWRRELVSMIAGVSALVLLGWLIWTATV